MLWPETPIQRQAIADLLAAAEKGQAVTLVPAVEGDGAVLSVKSIVRSSEPDGE